MIFRRGTIAMLLLAAGIVCATERDETWVQRRIAEIKDSDTTAWRKIPWASSLLAARRASEREERPIFLFTHDGNIDTGRC